MSEDERFEGALGRLTENEKDVLRRWLLPQTAKEIAIDLGVSPHAIEKRLKMVRAKLGVSSSLQAARLLADKEGYQWLVPYKPDLANSSSSANPSPREVSSGHQGSGRRLTARAVGGGMAMILLIGAMAFAGIDQEQPSVTHDRAVAFLVSSFGAMDRDRSGFIEPTEAPPVFVRDQNSEERRRVAGIQGQNMWIANHDKDGDGKVSEAEFVARMLPTIKKNGIPANWRENH